MIFIDIIDAISGILKRRKVANMLCAEYSYKMDIAVKKEEAAEDKAEEIATKMLSKEYPTTEISEIVISSSGSAGTTPPSANAGRERDRQSIKLKSINTICFFIWPPPYVFLKILNLSNFIILAKI